MIHFLVADGHYVGTVNEIRHWQILLKRAREEGMAQLSLLGDFFELWLALPGVMPAWHEDFFGPLRELKQQGVRLRYVTGNKDYFVSEWNNQAGIFDEVHEGSCTVESLAGTLVLAHGDLVNARDRQYRMWRAFSRSAPMRALMQATPKKHLRKLAQDIATRMASTNRYHKSYFPEAQLRLRARELPAGPMTLIFGHFHAHREMMEGDKRILTLPFLGGEHAGILVTARGFVRLASE